MVAIQLDFFRSNIDCEMDALRIEFASVKASGEKVRKGTYAEIGALKKRVMELEERLNNIERGLCYGN